jgi:tetratricopeptide (TPR) repeat protein
MKKRTTGAGLTAERRNRRGLELADRGWLEEALREFSLAIESDPQAAYPRVNRAGVLLEKRSWLEALEDLLAAARLEPHNGAVHYHLGLALAHFGEEMARDELEKAVELEPDNLDARIELARSYFSMGQTELAEKSLHEVLSLEPQDPWASRELGAIYLDTGRGHQAVEHLKAALACWPQDPDVMLDLAVAYIQIGFFEEAEKLLLRLIEIEPNNVHGYYNMAAICSQRGEKLRALKYLRQALKLDRSSVAIWIGTDEMFDNLRHDGDFQKLLSGANE